MNDKYTTLTHALKKAQKAAQVFADHEDGGTCNCDSPAIDYRAMHMSKSKTEEAVNAAGLRCFDWNLYGSKLLVVCGIGQGQGNRNSRMAESACESLKSDGIQATMYYQMD